MEEPETRLQRIDGFMALLGVVGALFVFAVTMLLLRNLPIGH